MSGKLKCKICGYESKNLEPHINSAHADLGGVSFYMEKYKVGFEGIIHPSILHKEEEERSIETTIEIKGEEMSSVEICGVSLPKINGDKFIPRANNAYVFGDHAKDIAYDVLEDKRVLLTGHTGCGKTSVIQQIANKMGQGVLRINLNGQTTIGDFVGLWTVKGGETVWVDGALPMALRNGYWLILDEIDFAEPAILAVLNAVLETGGDFVLKEKGYEVIKPHENFRLFATANTVGCMQDFRNLYQGANILNEAFLDRWRVYFVDYLPEDQEVKVLTDTIQKMTEKIARRIVMVGNMIREAFVKEEIACTFSLRRMLDWSEQMIRHRDPMKAAESTIFSKVSREDAEVIKGIITRVMLGTSK